MAGNIELLTWVKIDPDRPQTLPDDGETVLGWSDSWGEPAQCFRDMGEWKNANEETLSDQEAEDMLDENLRPPTHWAPWPSGPLE